MMRADAVVLVDADNVLGAERYGHSVPIEDLLINLRGHVGPASEILVFMSQPAQGANRVEHAVAVVKAALIRAQRNVDVALAVRATEVLANVNQLVLVSGDADFVPLLQAARAVRVHTVVVSPATHTSAALALAANQLLDPGELTPQLTGLILAGGGADATAAIIGLFKRARSRVVVIDPWVSKETVRLMAWSPFGVELVLVGARLDPTSLAEVVDVLAGGRGFKLYRSNTVHDRWFSVDNRWWHSGSSLKDLGRKASRISELEHPVEIAETAALLASVAIPANIVAVQAGT